MKIKELPSTNPKKEEIADEDKGFKSLYTGLDLKNWKVDQHAEGHFKPDDWSIHHDGKGGKLLSEKEYGDYELIVDWKMLAKKKEGEKGGSCVITLDNAGLSRTQLILPTSGKIRFINVAMSSIFSELTAEAKDLKLGAWNRTTITCKGETVIIALNGKTVLENAKIRNKGDKGRIGLWMSSAGDFANIFIRELK